MADTHVDTLAGGAAPSSPGRAVPADDDAALLSAARSGDGAAFAALLERHYDRLYRIAWRLTGSRNDAEDIVQEVCCTLVEKLDSFRGEARFSTWVTGILVNAARDQFRRGAAYNRMKRSVAILARLAPGPDGRDLYRRSWIESDLARLEPGLRDAVVLVAGEEMSHAEAAEILGVAESTVSWRLHEARRKLAARQTTPEEET